MKQFTYLLLLVILSACATTKPTLKHLFIGASTRSYYQGCLDKTNRSDVDKILCKSATQKHYEELNSALYTE